MLNIFKLNCDSYQSKYNTYFKWSSNWTYWFYQK